MKRVYSAAVCVILLLLYLLSNPKPETKRTITRKVIERPDSALISIDKTSPKLDLQAKLKVRERSLALDTIINHDTLRVAIAPDSTIRIQLLPAPRFVNEWVKFIRRDSLILQHDIERVYIAEPWYRSPLLVIAGAVLGFLIAVLL